MIPTNHPLTETAAAELWDDTPTIGGEWPWHQMDGTMCRRILAAMRAAYDAGREHVSADPHHDPRPWQDCTVKDIREGDLVESRVGVLLRIGVAHYQDEDGDWRTEEGWPLTHGDDWPLRRIPAPTPPAEEVELPTEDGAVIVPADGREFFETFAGRVDKLIHLSGKWYGGSFPLRPEQIAPGTWREADQ